VEKRAVGIAASLVVKSGMVVGLGTGSTVANTIRELGRRICEEGLEILGVVTSYQSEMLAIEAGIPLTTLAQHPEVDLAIDGADQIDSNLYAIKGKGAAHTREKIVSLSAKHFLVVVDDSKTSLHLNKAVPVEVLPFAKELVMKNIFNMGGKPELRLALRKDGPVVTDNGNFVLDSRFGIINDPESLALQLSLIPGVVEHGIFSNVNDLYIGKKDGSVNIVRK
jgi:ribose 5-phosphate isomerase A